MERAKINNLLTDAVVCFTLKKENNNEVVSAGTL